MRHDRGLLERRMHVGPVAEQQLRQKLVQSLASIAFIALLVVRSLEVRYRLIPWLW
jgi:hypothetical protein